MLPILVTHRKRGCHCKHQVEDVVVGSYVWFSEDQQSRLGKVLSVDSTSPRSIMVQLYAPQVNVVSLARAKFQSTRDQEGEPKVTRITMHQMQLRLQLLTTRGFLSTTDRRRLIKVLA